jgi:nucleoside-diphosphate-sugar epimerase
MSRILIAGCGYVGQATAYLFHERGWKVEGWTASGESAGRLAAKPYAVRAVNLTSPAAVSEVREEFDVVVQCASTGGGDADEYRRVYLKGARNLLHAFPSARLIFTSSTSVYAQRQGEIVDETSPADPAHEKGRILREAEELVLSHDGIVARLGGIYGPSRSFLLRKVLAGGAILDEGGERFVNQVHRDDIASGLFLLAERRSELARQIYNVVDDQPILARDARRWLSAHLPRTSPTGEAAAARKRGDTNKRVSNKKLRALGWEPRYPNFAVAMTESILPSFGFGRETPP